MLQGSLKLNPALMLGGKPPKAPKPSEDDDDNWGDDDDEEEEPKKKEEKKKEEKKEEKKKADSDEDGEGEKRTNEGPLVDVRKGRAKAAGRRLPTRKGRPGIHLSLFCKFSLHL